MVKGFEMFKLLHSQMWLGEHFSLRQREDYPLPAIALCGGSVNT